MLKIYTLTDARRHLRRIHLATERRSALLKNSESARDVDQTHSSMQTWSKELQGAQSHAEEINAIKIALSTELYDESNTYMIRLQRATETTLLQINQQITDIEDRLSSLTTKFDSKLRVLLKDLERRFRQYQTRFLVRQVSGQEIGVLALTKQHDTKCAFCVILAEPMQLEKNEIQAIGRNQYKMFFNTIPPDLVLENFQPFLSPSKLAAEINKTLRTEGF